MFHSKCFVFLAAMMYALVFGNVTAIVQRAYARRATFHMKTNDLKEFYHTYNIPKPLKHRIQDYFQSMWTMNNGINLNEVKNKEYFYHHHRHHQQLMSMFHSSMGWMI